MKPTEPSFIIEKSPPALPGDTIATRYLGVVVIAVLVAAVCAAHWPIVNAQAHCYDDGEYVLQNRFVQYPSWSSSRRFLTEVIAPSSVKGYYQPITMISLMLDWARGGRADDFKVFHQTNLLLHSVNVVLVYLIVLLLFRFRWPAAITAALFGLHPMTVEPLAWLSDRKTLLATCFSLICILGYLKSTQGHRARWIAVSVAAYLAALMSKPTAVPIAAVLVILDWWPLNRIGWKTLIEKIPFFVLAGAFSWISFMSQERTAGIEANPAGDGLRIPMTFAYLVSTYLGRMIWPSALSVGYALPKPFAMNSFATLVPIAATLALGGACILMLRRTRGPAASLLVFVVAALPVLGFFKFSWMPAADKYVYLPAFGVLLGVGWAVAALWRSDDHRATSRRIVISICAILVLVAEARASRGYARNWQTTETLYRHIIANAPDTPAAHNNLGNMLADQKRYDEASFHFQEAIRVYPEYIQAHFNLGNIFAKTQRWQDAVKEFSYCLDVDPEDAELRFQLGVTLRAVGRRDDAVVQFLKASELRPTDGEYRYQLGVAYLTCGRLADAEQAMHEALTLEPDNAELRNNYGTLLLQRGLAAEAIVQFEHAVRVRRGYAKAENNLGAALSLADRPTEACAHFAEAIRLSPDWIAPMNSLAWIMATCPDAKARNGEKAVQNAMQAKNLMREEDAGTLDTLAAAYAEAGQFPEAVKTAEQARDLAMKTKQEALSAEIAKRLDLYRRSQPYRDPPPTTSLP